jgi:DNA-binding NarL/FixJ family response regulator
MSELVERHHPDLLVVEPFFGYHDGIFLLKQLAARFPKTRILAVSRQPEEIYAEGALRAGASGYWMKTGTREELIRAIDTVLKGELSWMIIMCYFEPSGRATATGAFIQSLSPAPTVAAIPRART